MRSKNTGMIKDIAKQFTARETLEMFQKVCLSRFFELNVRKAIELKLIKGYPLYLSLGQESIAAALATVFRENIALFGQHRCHDIYLSFGGNIEALIDELLGRPTGCAKGMGGSASIHFHSDKVRMFGHDGLMGTQVPIAVGYTLGTRQNSITFMGDASAEEGFVLGALGYGATKKAPVLFIVCDNGLSILTKTEVRRNWTISEHANFGMEALEITDDPWLIMHHAVRLKKSLPALFNIQTCRTLWHAGSGQDNEPEWDRFYLIKETMAKLGLEDQADYIEHSTHRDIDNLWDRKLEEKS